MIYFTIITYILFSVSGIILFKLGAKDLLSVNVTSQFFNFQIGWISILGLFCYICSFILYMFLIAKNNLSNIVPLVTGAVYILIMLSSVVIFKERITTFQIIGSLLIFVGVILINIKIK